MESGEQKIDPKTMLPVLSKEERRHIAGFAKLYTASEMAEAIIRATHTKHPFELLLIIRTSRAEKALPAAVRTMENAASDLKKCNHISARFKKLCRRKVFSKIRVGILQHRTDIHKRMMTSAREKGLESLI